jgi:hypothetical protein
MASGDEPQPLTLTPAWKVGEKFRYEMTRKNSREANGKSVSNSARTPVDVEVISRDERKYILRWRLGETTSDVPKSANNPLVQALARLTNGMNVDLEIAAGGEFLGISNWKELQKKGKEIQKTILEELADANLPEGAIEKLAAETDKLFANKQAVEMSFARQPTLLIHPLGQTYDAESPATSETTLPNQFGGEPIPAVVSYALGKQDRERKLATIVVTQKPDATKLKAILEKSLRDLAKRLGKNIDGPLPAFELTDEAEYLVETKTGWILRATHTRRTRTGGASVSIETTTLTRSDMKGRSD